MFQWAGASAGKEAGRQERGSQLAVGTYLLQTFIPPRFLAHTSEPRVEPGIRNSLFCSGVRCLPNSELREHPLFRWENGDRNRGKGLVAAALAPSPPRALCPVRGQRVDPRKSSYESALSAQGTGQGLLARDRCWLAPRFHKCRWPW